MNRLTLLALLIWLCTACGREEGSEYLPPATEAVQLASSLERAERKVVPHGYLVAFRNLLDAAPAAPLSFQGTLRAHLSALSQKWARPGSMSDVRYLNTLNLNDLGESFSPRASIQPAPWLQQKPIEDLRLANVMAIRFRSEEEAARTLQKWQEEGRIWFAEPDYRSQTFGPLEDTLVENFEGNATTPWLDQINFVSAIQEMALVPNKAQPLIAVMDSGVDVQHESLSAAIYRNENGQNKFCSGDFFGCNTTIAKKENLGDGNVFPAGTTGFGQVCPVTNSDLELQCQHGTHVAGIIAAQNSDLYSGICPYCKILVVKVVEIDATTGTLAIADSAIIAGLSYISGFKEGGEPQVRIINASFGKYERSRSVELFVRALRQSGRGILMIAAAGNEDVMKRTYPASFDDVIGVANVESSRQLPIKAKSSNFGSWVDISAPGEGRCPSGNSNGIYSTLPGNRSGCKPGTSMAAPIVAGVAGLMLAKEPGLSADEIDRRLRLTADPVRLYRDDLNGAYSPTLGNKIVPLLGTGLVDAYAALRPNDDKIPALASGNANLVKGGCSVIGAHPTEGSRPWLWLLYLCPLFAALASRMLHKDSDARGHRQG